MRIRVVAAIGALSVIALTLATLVPLFWSEQLLGHTTDLLARDAERARIAARIELDLDTYSRLSTLQALTGEATLTAEKQELAADMHELLRRAPAYAHTNGERITIADIARDLDAYFAERARIDASGLSPERIARAIAPYFERTKTAVEHWRRASEEEVRAAHATAVHVHRVARVTASVAAAALLVVVLLFLVGLRRYLVLPIVGLHRVVVRLREGDGDVRANERGPLEVSELARALNQLIEALTRQRNGELAFLAGVAHDLRNPLSALKMGVHVLGSEEARDQHPRTLAMVDRQVDRLARMVDELFDATQVAAGVVKLDRRPFDVREIAREVVQLYELASPAHELTLHAPDEPVIVDGDAARIEQVVNNLVSNAIKFSPNGGRVDVRVEVVGGDAVIAVADHGIGIAPEQIQDLFMPFRRRAPEIAPGAGLGLSVVRRIVSAHGGSIDVESTPGVGSTFRARFPLAGAPRETSGDRESAGAER